MKYTVLTLIALFLFPNIVMAVIPNDPYAEQWAYNDIGAYKAWDYSTGSKDIIVAIIDNGFDTFHPDLFDNVWINDDEIRGNGVDDDNNGYIDDIWGWNFIPQDTDNNGYIDEDEWNGNNDPRPYAGIFLQTGILSQNQTKNGAFNHATIVAGIIGAKGDNGLDGVGINWNVRLMNLKVVESDGVGTIFYVAKAIRYAVDNGADIINISLVGTDSVDDVKEAIQYAYGKGVVIIAAAGNNSINLDDYPFYPICADAWESTDRVLGASAIQESHYRSPFSNLGSSCIDLTAPGQNVSSTIRFSPKNGLDKRYAGGNSGTSFSAPLISGAAALIKSIQPTWGPTEIFYAILSTVHKTPPKNDEEYTSVFGAGLLQIDKAVAYAISKLQASHPINVITILNKISGQMYSEKVNLNTYDSPSIDFVKNIDDVVSFKNNGEKMYATVSQISSLKSEVIVYDSNWFKKYSWIIDSRGAFNMEAGDVLGLDQSEIILFPTNSDDLLFKIFSLDGKLLKENILDGMHGGVDLTLVGAENNKKKISVLVNQWGKVRVLQLDANLKIQNEFFVDLLASKGNISSGDIDGDGIQNIVVAGGKGELPWILTYSNTGKLLRSFWGFDPGYLGGLLLEVGDYNMDNIDDIIVASPNEVRVFTGSVKRIGEWTLPPAVSINGALFIN